MALFKPTYNDKKSGKRVASAVWWFEFAYLGRRYRESTKTTRKTLAADFEKRRRLELERHHTVGTRPSDPALMMRSVEEAVNTYQVLYDAPNHRPKSIAWVKERSPHLIRLLGKFSILDLSETRITAYMKTRHAEGAGSRTTNMELQCLTRAIGRTWAQLWPGVPRLAEPTDIGQALSPEDEGRLLGAASKNKSPFVFAFIRVALLTGMRSGEIRNLQMRNIDLANKELRVGKSKTAAGEGRGIPMNADLFETLSAQAAWLTATFGKPLPTWFLFPLCDRVRPIDPTKPVTAVKSAWQSVRKAAGVDCRLHDLRHTAATKMAENGVPEATMKALLGHMSRAMMERYSHIRSEAKRAAVEGLALAKPIFAIPKETPKVTPLRKKSG